MKLRRFVCRIYGGYALGPLNPEPYAYESSFSVKWLIADQIAGKPAQSLNWTCAGICAHESAMRGGEIVRLPDFSAC